MDATLPDDQIVFVPDGALHGVPFAALQNPESGRFLIEDHPVSVAPSATLYLQALRRDRSLQRAEEPSALFVGDPEFEQSRFVGLDRLPYASTEARQGASQYTDATLLEAGEATRRAFLRRAGQHDIVHFAGHAVLNPQAPFKSMLVLAPSVGVADSGVLYADELLRHELPRTRLVVLSACSTAAGQSVGALGVAPLVRPFLGGGVPAVIGSLWDVDDPAAARLLTTFHRQLREGMDAAAALRNATVSLLEDDRLAFSSPRSWAAFQLVGTASLNQRQHEE
jgi:CHAT domain-containing protein